MEVQYLRQKKSYVVHHTEWDIILLAMNKDEEVNTTFPILIKIHGINRCKIDNPGNIMVIIDPKNTLHMKQEIIHSSNSMHLCNSKIGKENP
jgi:hypothetical protein